MSLPDAARRIRAQRELHEAECDYLGALRRLDCIKTEIAYSGESDARLRRLVRAYHDIDRTKDELAMYKKYHDTIMEETQHDTQNCRLQS